MEEKELFLTLTIVGFVLGVIGFSAITGGLSGAVVYEPGMHNVAQHSRCVNGQCIILEGPGNSECEINSHCSHLGCKGRRCVLIDSPGTDWCDSDIDCY